MATGKAVDNSKNDSSWGGKRPGAGRPQGKANAATIERAAIKRALQDRVAQHVDRLFHAQMTLAEGVTYLYRIDQDSKGKNLPAVRVDDPGEIKAFIDGEVDGDSYYYITTDRPDNRAIDSLLDRAFGKADQKLEASGPDGRPLLLINMDPEGGDPSTVNL